MMTLIPKKDITIVEIHGSQTALEAEAIQMRGQLLELASTEPALLLDCQQLSFADANFLGLIVRVSKRLQQRQAHFALCNVQAPFLEMLQVCRLTDLLQIYPSRKAAFDDLKVQEALEPSYLEGWLLFGSSAV